MKILSVFCFCATLSAEVTVKFERNEAGDRRFQFKEIPRPSRADAASTGTFSIVEGQPDPNGAPVSALGDGRLPTQEDEPGRNFFFNAGSQGGKIQLDLGRSINIKEIRSYSWHPGSRGPQKYSVFDKSGGKIASVETEGDGGQYAVSIKDVGRHQVLIFDISPTVGGDRFAQTFLSEIDVIDADANVAEEAPEPEPKESRRVVEFDGYRFTFDTTLAPDLIEWTDTKLIPVIKEWYPKLVSMLPSDNYQAPTNLLARYRDDMGGTPASAGGNNINLNVDWFRKNLDGEAVGSVVHEMVHSVQQYNRGRRNNPEATRTPGWIVEGIPDYIRWFLYEPQTQGARITKRNLERAKYDASYRVTGNFLDWVVRTYDKDIIRKLNAAAREGRYKEELWKDFTGKTVQELGEEWRKGHEERIAKEAEPAR